MKKSAIVCAFTAAALGLGSVSAVAQRRDLERERNIANNPMINPPGGTSGPGVDRRDDRERENRARNIERNAQRRDFEQQARERRDFARRENDRRAYEQRHFGRDLGDNRYYYGARSPEFRRGGYIPYEYRNRQYYVNDWRAHRLPPPPYGHQWVQVGPDYVLIAVATGLIASLILNQ